MSLGLPLILVAAGVNLILAQYWTMKEYLLVLASSEVTILLVTCGFFASCSLGYLLASHRLRRYVVWASLPLAALQLAFPWFLKELAALFYRGAVPHITPVLLGFGVLIIAPLYTVLLPYMIEAREQQGPDRPASAVAVCYGLELCGALLGIAFILMVGRRHFLPLLVLYFLNLGLILAYLYDSKRLLYGAIPIALCYGVVYPPLDRAATEDFYRSRGYPSIRLVESAQSLYNRIDVLQDGDGKLLLMNGREYFNPGDLEAFNQYVAGIPSALMPGSRVLIVGTGSLSSVYHASRTATSIDSVEIDPHVVELAKRHFSPYNHLEEVRNWRLHIDDAKHFLGSSNQIYDLIILDMVPPVYVQTALLFTREFYELAKAHLAPQGVLSIYTGSWFDAASLSQLEQSTEKTIDAVFPEYLVVNSRAAGMAFVYASSHLPFGKPDVLRLLGTVGTDDQDQVLDATEARLLIQDKKVVSLNNLRMVLEWSPSSYRTLASGLGTLGLGL